MIVQPSAEQRELIADAFSRPLDALLPLSRLHKADAAEPWTALAELGLFGVAADPDIGGVGLSAVEEALLAIELGRKAAGPQILATLMAYHCAPDELRARIVTGEARVAPGFVRGDRVCLVDADGAGHLLLRWNGDAALIAAETASGRATLDSEHWTVTLEAADVALPDEWVTGDAVLRIRLIEAAALAGIATAATEMAVAYAGFRDQFGHPIGGFQAVKHHCANMATAALAARDLVTFASVALDQDRADAAFQVEAALLLAIDSALLATRKNVQVHGGIGFSDEADPHLLVKRAHLLIEAAGGSDNAGERVASAEPPMRQ